MFDNGYVGKELIIGLLWGKFGYQMMLVYSRWISVSAPLPSPSASWHTSVGRSSFQG